MQASIEELYTRHIRPRPREERLRLVELTTQDLAAEQPDDAHNLDITELHGLGKEIWNGVDAQAYVDELRSEWDHRP